MLQPEDPQDLLTQAESQEVMGIGKREGRYGLG
jgi:hypothetical protein